MDDIRDQAHLSGEEIRKLNFIKDSQLFAFRKFYRSGLRSHIFEVVLSRDLRQETEGVIQDGIRVFPRARPIKMFRIFRRRFQSKEEIFHEIRRYKTLIQFLGPRFIARSEEFITDYRGQGLSRILLCGLQEYVAGEILDPWRLNGVQSLESLLRTMCPQAGIEDGVHRAQKSIADFTSGVRRLILETAHIPDLAGVGNLILTPQGEIRLVDINNIVHVRLDPEIHLDDKGYPACDVSVQVLFLLEKELLGKAAEKTDPLFRNFLDPERQARVKAIERQFYRDLF